MAQKLVLKGFCMLEKFNKFFIKRVIALFTLFFIINIVASLPSLNIFVDIFSHFKVQYFYISFFFLVSFVYLTFFNKKFIIGIALSLFIAGINYFSITPFVEKLPEAFGNKVLKIGLFNVHTRNKRVHLLLDEIYDNNPDIIILQEVNETWLNYVQGLKSNYPYFKEYPREDNFGIALYSKTPLKNAKVEFWGDYLVPVITAEIDNIEVYCVHTLPPVNKEYIKTRNEMLQKIGHILGSAPMKDQNVLIAGDFNTTLFSESYYFANPPLNSYPIYDAVKYLPKYKGSWNAYHLPFFRITLEHILTTHKIVPTKVYFEKQFGSDHLPVFAEFNILNP